MDQHTKNPRYSVLSVMFRLADSNPMLMHMVVSLAGQQLASLSSKGNVECQASVEHYSAAMRLMADAVQSIKDSRSLDIILATLCLMVIYETRFGR